MMEIRCEGRSIGIAEGGMGAFITVSAAVGSVAVESGTYVLMGQSNISGAGASPHYPLYPTSPDPKIFFYNDPGSAVGVPFARYLLAYAGNQRIKIVMCAVGSYISAWLPGQALYENCMGYAEASAASGFPVRGIVWQQGESDAQANGYETTAWKATFESIMGSARTRLGLSLPVVYGQVGPITLDGFPNLRHIQDEINSVTLSNSSLVVADGVVLLDGIHYTPESYEEMGRRYAAAMWNIRH